MQGYFNSIGCCKMNRHWQSSEIKQKEVLYGVGSVASKQALNIITFPVTEDEDGYYIGHVDYQFFQSAGNNDKGSFSNGTNLNDYYIPYRIYGTMACKKAEYGDNFYTLRNKAKLPAKDFKGSTINNSQYQTEEYYDNFKLPTSLETIDNSRSFEGYSLEEQITLFDVDRNKLEIRFSNYRMPTDDATELYMYVETPYTKKEDNNIYIRQYDYDTEAFTETKIGSLKKSLPITTIQPNIGLTPLVNKEDITIQIHPFRFYNITDKEGIYILYNWYFNGYISFFENVK